MNNQVVPGLHLTYPLNVYPHLLEAGVLMEPKYQDTHILYTPTKALWDFIVLFNLGIAEKQIKICVCLLEKVE
jgi:hypothetical protein